MQKLNDVIQVNPNSYVTQYIKELIVKQGFFKTIKEFPNNDLNSNDTDEEVYKTTFRKISVILSNAHEIPHALIARIAKENRLMIDDQTLTDAETEALHFYFVNTRSLPVFMINELVLTNCSLTDAKFAKILEGIH